MGKLALRARVGVPRQAGDLMRSRDSGFHTVSSTITSWESRRGTSACCCARAGTFLWSAIESRAYQHTWTFGDAAFDSHSVDLHYREDPSYLLLPPSSPTNRQESGDGRAQLFRTQVRPRRTLPLMVPCL